MSFTVTDFSDLLRILEAHPEWRQKLRQALFPEIDLPKALQELAEAQSRTEIALQHLETVIARLEATVEKLAIGQQALWQNMDKLTDGQQDLRQDMDKLMIGQQGLGQEVDKLTVGQQGLRQEVDKLVVGQQGLRQDVSELKGKSHEQSYLFKADAIFGRYLRRGKNITDQVADQLFEALEAGQVSETEYRQVLAADLLWGGQDRQTREEVILVLEASWLAEVDDVERAVARTAVLRRIGLKALAVVAGRKWTDQALELARQQRVVLTTNGQVDADSWQAAQFTLQS